MKRLSRANLAFVPAEITAPRRRRPLSTGIVHFGPGAFHRAHQAAFIDRLLDDDPRWGIAAVSLRSRATIAALTEQNGLYALAVRDRTPEIRVIGAHAAFLGPDAGLEVRALLADPAVTLVTSTITEKGYCLRPDGELDFAHTDIMYDLAGPAVPRSLIGWLVVGLAARWIAKLNPFVPMPCDNLADNGRKLHRALIAFARQRDANLADWIAGEVRVPSTMVDAITPASDAALLADVANTLGLEDRCAVQREAFTQWVIEDLGPLGPDLASAGATLTPDVAGFERAKLRILNGAHSALAYLGLARGHESVAEAMADPELGAFIKALIRDEIMPVVGAVSGLDLRTYAYAVLDRFRNPAIVHRLDQIAQDGSQKMPYRLGDTLLAHRRSGRLPARILLAFGAWIDFVRRRTIEGVAVIDPLAAQMGALATRPAREAVVGFAKAGIGLPLALADDEAVIAVIAKALGTTGLATNLLH